MKRPAGVPASLGLWHPASLLSTWFGVGLLPYAPGTWGSLAAIPFAYALVVGLGKPALLVATVAVFLAGWWAASAFSKALGVKDARQIVVDEVVGQWLVLLAAPLDPVFYFAAFVLFRVFDIVKPWPANRFDRDLSGGLGVMLDDVAAGIYGFLVLGAGTLILEAL
jgi:phosphatidylglycerophosphatase A